MNSFAQKKPDYVFIASLIAIVIVAIYLAMDRFQDSGISGYLQQKGQELLAQIDNPQERESLQSEYDDFITKVADREVQPEKVEQFISAIFNLNQSRANLNKDEFAYLFQENLQKAVQIDTIKKIHKTDNERWEKIQQRLQDLKGFEEKVKNVVHIKPELENSFSFSYTIDDSLNISINENIKDNFVIQDELASELKRLEKENALRWRKEVEAIENKEQKLQEVMIRLEAAEAAMSVIAIGKDTVKVTTPIVPVVIEAPKSATEDN